MLSLLSFFFCFIDPHNLIHLQFEIYKLNFPFATASYLKNANNVTTSKLYDVIAGLNGFEFGSFDEFAKIKDIDVSDLDHIDLKELYKRVSKNVMCTFHSLKM